MAVDYSESLNTWRWCLHNKIRKQQLEKKGITRLAQSFLILLVSTAVIAFFIPVFWSDSRQPFFRNNYIKSYHFTKSPRLEDAAKGQDSDWKGDWDWYRSNGQSGENQGKSWREGRNPSITTTTYLLWETNEWWQNSSRLQNHWRFSPASGPGSERRLLCMGVIIADCPVTSLSRVMNTEYPPSSSFSSERRNKLSSCFN